MPPTPLTHRPQTLKQAKKAYRKAGATVRLSESEKAVLERRAVLQARADRIKEREARRKANLKRKEERVQKEREARQRMGIPTPPAKEGIHVGPSQLDLSEFIYGGVKTMREGEVEDEEGKELVIQKDGDLMVQKQQECPMEPPRSRQPLQTLSGNARPKCVMPSQVANADPPKVRDFAVQENQTAPKRMPPAYGPVQAKSAHSVIQQKPMAVNKSFGGLPAKASDLQRPQALQVVLPSLHPCVQAIVTKSPIFKKPPLIPLLPKPEAISEDCFDDFFVSNTQIQRELSPPPTPTPQAAASKPPAADENNADLLAFLSTQDLDFSDDLTQLAPTARHAEPQDETELDSDFPDDELEDIALEFELEPPLKSSNAPTPDKQDPQPNLSTSNQTDSDKSGGSHYDSDDAETQASLQTASKDHEQEKKRQDAHRAAEWDAFDLSTQDLKDLES